MDELEGKNRWREVPESGFYNHRMLQEKINQLNNMMQNGDVFQVRASIAARPPPSAHRIHRNQPARPPLPHNSSCSCSAGASRGASSAS